MFRPRRRRTVTAETLPPCRWYDGEEPSVSELLADPIVHLVMQRDRIGPADVEAALTSVQSRRARDLHA